MRMSISTTCSCASVNGWWPSYCFFVVLFCVVTSKICLLVLGQHFKSVNSTGNNDTDKTAAKTSKQALFLMLLLVLTIPQVVSLIYASWTSLSRKSRPWPTKQGFLLVRDLRFLKQVVGVFLKISSLQTVPEVVSALVHESTCFIATEKSITLQ